MKAALFLIAALACGACTSYRAVSVPPPSRAATLDNNDDVRISQGVALGFECATAWGNTCATGATTDDPKVARVFPAHLAKLEGYMNGVLPPSSYVIVGVKPGHTLLRIAGEDAIDVEVVP